MPRKGGITQNFNPLAEATNTNVVAAVEANTVVLRDVKSHVEELGLTAKRTHLGHEAHLWGAEVTADDVEEG